MVLEAIFGCETKLIAPKNVLFTKKVVILPPKMALLCPRA